MQVVGLLYLIYSQHGNRKYAKQGAYYFLFEQKIARSFEPMTKKDWEHRTLPINQESTMFVWEVQVSTPQIQAV